MASNPSRTYWAAETDSVRFISRVNERYAWHLEMLQRSGRLGKMRALISAYYGYGTDGARSSNMLQGAGEDGEVTEMHINAVRPIVNNTVSLIAGQELSMRAKARNGDAKTLAETRLAEMLLRSYDNATASKEAELDVVRGGLLASSWTLGQSWLPTEGEEWAVDDNGKPLFEGDLDIFVLPTWRIVFDPSSSDAAKRKWASFRRPASRWDLAAQLELKGRIEDAGKLRNATGAAFASSTYASRMTGADVSTIVGNLDALMGEVLSPEDSVWVYEVRHLPSAALPRGRTVRFVEPDIILYDGPYHYDRKDLHLYEFCPERVITGAGGHTGAFDLGGGQEFLDIIATSVANQANIAGQMQIWTPDDSPPPARSLSTGNTVINGKTKPEVLQFPALKPELLTAGDWCLSNMRQSMALNDVVMGRPDKGMPASAQALQRAQAVQFHAVAQGERVRLAARNANGKLKILKRFADSPRVLELAGKDRAYEVREWESKDIESVERFEVEPINPATNALEGRQGVAEMLMQTGGLKDPDAMLTFLQTGSLDAITSTERQRRELVESHVSLLQRGIGPPPINMPATQAALMEDPSALPVFAEPQGEAVIISPSDPHHLAIPAFLGVMASPTSRTDAAVMKACTEAVQISLQMWQSLSPDQAMSYGIPPLPSHMAAAPMPPGGPGGGPPGAPPDMGEPPPEEKSPDSPPLPRPPKDPLTGDREQSEATGLSQ